MDEGQVARQVMKQRMAPALRLERKDVGGIAPDVDPIHRVHLYGHRQTHAVPIHLAAPKGRVINHRGRGICQAVLSARSARRRLLVRLLHPDEADDFLDAADPARAISNAVELCAASGDAHEVDHAVDGLDFVIDVLGVLIADDGGC